MAKKATPPPAKLVEFPKTLYAVYSNHGSEDDEYLYTFEDLASKNDCDNPTVKVARYKLVGTGVIHTDTPYYVEDATT